MIRLKHLFLTTALILSATFSVADDVEPVFEFKPTILHPAGAGRYLGAARLSLSYDPADVYLHGSRQRGQYFYRGFEAASTLSTSAKNNPEPTTLDARLGLFYDLDPIPPPVEVFPGKQNGGNQRIGTTAPASARWGAAHIELAGGFEGDEPMVNRQWTYGVRVAYVNALEGDRLLQFVPRFWIDYRRIDEVGSAVSARAGIPDQDYWRLGAGVEWIFQLRRWEQLPDFAQRLTFVPSARYYKSTDYTPTRANADLDDAYYYSIAAQYAFPKKQWLFNRVTITVSNGRLPPSTRSGTTVAVSIDARIEDLLHWNR